MTRADKPKCRNKALAASNAACMGAVVCFLCSGGGACPDLIGTPPVGQVNSRLSQLAAHSITQRGCAALTCGKPLAFRPTPYRLSSSSQAGRLSLPAWGEEVIQEGRPSERQSLSANQAAEPQVIVCRIARNLNKPEVGFPLFAMFVPPGEVNSPLQSSTSPQPPPCIAESAFFKNLPKDFRWPDPGDMLSLRVLEEYGAIFVARGGVVLPPVVIFPDQSAVAHWQSSISTDQAELAGITVRLQSAAMRALMEAREEAFQAHFGISPRGSDAAQRSYDETLKLWRSRVNPGLQHWVGKGLLSAAEAERIRKLPAREQAPVILELEKRGLYFSRDFSKSVLFSVAPPGASQHLSMLAFDVKEHNNPVVRSILEHHGWFQTVRSDLPHFTYLGVDKHLLPSLGLRMLRNGDRVFWIPDLACPQAASP